MKGKFYFNWLTEEEKDNYRNNWNDLELINRGYSFEEHLNRDFKDWLGFLGTSFDFNKTIEGGTYWGMVYRKYKDKENFGIDSRIKDYLFIKKPKIF